MSRISGAGALWRAVYDSFLLAGSSLRMTRRQVQPGKNDSRRRTRSRIEKLEDRVHFAASPYIVGLDQAQQGVPYQLNLVANGRNVDHWSIDWGDAAGSTASPETVPGASTTATHTFGIAAQDQIVATAYNKRGMVLATATLGIAPTLSPTGMMTISQEALAAMNGAADTVQAVTVQPDGKILVLTSEALDRFNADGSADSTFGAGGVASLPTVAGAAGNGLAFDVMALGPNGQIAIGGISKKTWVIGVYDSTGNLTFTDTKPSAQGHPLHVADIEFGNGAIILLGSDKKGNNVLWIDNLNTSAASVVVSGNDANWSYKQAAVDPTSGEVWIVGDKNANLFLAHYDASGNELSVTKLKKDTDGSGGAVAIDANGNVLVAGQSVSRYTSVGELDTSFGGGKVTLPAGFALDIVNLVPLPNGQILAVGQGDQTVARFNSDGSLDSTFGIGGVLTTGLNVVDPGGIAQAGDNYQIAGTDGVSVYYQLIYPASNTLTVLESPAPVLTLSGNAVADAGVSYTLNLAAQYPAGDASPGTLSAWVINWGDGANGVQDVQPVPGSATAVTHTFTAGGPTAITAIAADQYGTYTAPPLNIEVNSNGPVALSFQVNAGSSDRTNVTSVTVAFSEPVTLGPSAFQLVETDNVVGSPVPLAFNVAASTDGTAYTLTFPGSSILGGSLPNGTYGLSILASAVTNSGGLPMPTNQTFDFYRLNSSAVSSGNPQFTSSEVNLGGFAPVALLTSISTVLQGSPQTITALTAPYGNNGDTLRYRWTVLDGNGNAVVLPAGGITVGPSLTFTPATPGTWSAELTVTDVSLSLSTSVGPIPFKVTTVLPAFPYTFPASNPALPSGINPFSPAFTGQSAFSGTPIVAASDNNAGPDDSITMTGTQFTTLTGAKAFTDTQFLVYGQTTANNATQASALVRDTNANAVVVTLPATEPVNSLYLVWPENTVGAGTPIAINDTQATWISAQTASAGQTVSIYGQNLSNGAATQQSWVYLQPTSGAGGQWAAVTAVNPYKVDFTVPAALANGTYQVWINNGLGGKYSWSQSPQTMTVAPATGWPSQFTYNIMNLNVGAVANGTTDDTQAILAALQSIRAVQAANPGACATLYFPTGTYLVSSAQISLPSNVRILGDGAGQTTLLFTGNLDTFYATTDAGPYAIGVGDGDPGQNLGYQNVEFDSLSMVYNGPSTDGEIVRERYGGHFTFNNVSLVATNGNQALDWQGSSNLILQNSTLVGQSINLIAAHDVQINNTMYYLTNNAEEAFTVWAGFDISITNSSVADYNESLPTGWGQGRLLEDNLCFGSIYNEYIADNSTLNLGTPAIGQNEGEQLLIEGALDVAYGTPLAATSNSVTLPLSSYLDGMPAVGESLTVTAGMGLGQAQVIQSVTVANGQITLTFANPWKLLPDSTSHVLVSTTASNSVFYQNNLQDQTGVHGAANLTAATGFEVWSGGYNLVFDGNTTNHLNSGVVLDSFSSSHLNPCDFIQITNNQINNSYSNGINLRPDQANSDPNFVGVIARNNTINGVSTSIGGSYAFTIARFQGEVPSFAILEHNTITNAPVGFYLFADPDVLIYDNTVNAGTFPSGNAILLGSSSANAILIGNVYQGFN